jgi:hypothetical protein
MSGWLALRDQRIGEYAGFFLFVTRGLLLWLVAPLLFRLSPGAFRGWVDLNLMGAISRSVLRPWIPRAAYPWVPFAEVRHVKHRMRFTDLA